MIKYLSRISFRYPISIIYMLQSTEYKTVEYLNWIRRVKDFRKVSQRNKLHFSNKAKLLLLSFVLIEIFFITIGLILLSNTINDWRFFVGLLLIIVSPIISEYLIVLPLFIGELFIQKPKSGQLISDAREIIKSSNALKIAIIGSYGKTSAKEILSTILSESKSVTKTPGNINTLIGISRFVKNHGVNSEVIIFELGEEKVGDIKKLCNLVQPDLAIITGISEAHLSSFKNIDNLVNTIFEVDEFLPPEKIYINVKSKYITEKIKNKNYIKFGKTGCRDFKTGNVANNLDGLKFNIVDNKKIIHANTNILGDHNLGILCASVDIAKSVGVSDVDIEKGLSKISAFEHRMSPRIIDGAVIIDDTYNGNSEGIRAGLEYLKNVSAKRKIYVTPGLVEQGSLSSNIHYKIGQQIAESADVVYLMSNSTTNDILNGIKSKNFTGVINIVNDPLDFYSNIEHIIASGDVVLMQNDWTDNYA